MKSDNASLVFSRNIRHLRKTHGLTKREMARDLGIGVHSLSLLERGIIPPRLSCDVLWTMARRFELKLSDLFRPLYEPCR